MNRMGAHATQPPDGEKAAADGPARGRVAERREVTADDWEKEDALVSGWVHW